MIESNRIPTDDDVLQVLVLIKGGERYVWVYERARAQGVLRSLARYACREDLSLTWYDAAQLADKIVRAL